MKTQFITDEHGKKVSVLISMKDFNKLKEELEELDDIRAFDKAMKEDDGTHILFSDYLKNRKKRNAKLNRDLVLVGCKTVR